MDTLTLFSKNLNQRSLTPRWPLTPCLLRSHVWLYPRIIVSKSHDDTSMYVDTVINFANYHIHTYTYYVHTTYILHTTYRMSDHIVSYWTQFRRDNKKVCLHRVWTRLITAYLLCAREFRQNNALALQFWCLSNALTLRVRALDASKSQRACIILSKFTAKVNTQLLIYKCNIFLNNSYLKPNVSTTYISSRCITFLSVQR